MCLILFAVSPNTNDTLIVAANRDEFHGRPTKAADFWPEEHVLGGIDLQAGGTWLGLTKSGRFAAVTNFAEPPADPLPPKSRGILTSGFLKGEQDPLSYLQDIQKEAHLYRGFNLILSDGLSTWYFSNRDQEIKALTPGYYGLSNQLLDCDWPKVNSARDELADICKEDFDKESLFNLLAFKGNDEPHSARFIIGETYGTSISTVVRLNRESHFFEERSFDTSGGLKRSKEFTL